MAISRVCYCSREDVKTALDFKETARSNPQVDRAIQSAADNIEGFTHRSFYPLTATRVFGPLGPRAAPAPAGALAAAMTDTTGTAVTVTSGAGVGAGSSVLVDSERMLVTERAMTDTTVAFPALSASAADNVITVPDGTKFTAGETLAPDSERMLLTHVSGNALTVKRAWDGTVLALHTSGTIWAARALTVTRVAPRPTPVNP